MDITQIPFNRLIDLERCETREEGLFQLAADPKFTNHIGTVHGAAIFALAEASSGEFLIRNLKLDLDTIIPVVRRAEIKFRKPAEGLIYARGLSNEDDWLTFAGSYAKRARAMIGFQIEVLDSNDVVVAAAAFDWFITKRP